jgi:D-methionine transport system ATP-binding protein
MLQLEGVGHAYGLHGVTLEVPRGARLALVGESGAGKSTLLRCLNLLVRPDRGRVLFDGVELTALDESSLASARRKLGMIFQHFALLHRRTARENVALPLELAGWPTPEIDARVNELLERVWLKEKADAWPAQLSGGQRQRVGIARALAHGPQVLLCDEPTSALDPRTARQIIDLLLELGRDLQLTVVLVAHQLGVVRRFADWVAVLDGGLLAELTPAEAFFAKPRSPAGARLLEYADV